jgi:DNA gyrase subunit B
MAKKKTKGDAYDASKIQVLEGLEPVRKRPGMYIGTTGLDGLHHLIWEVFDNSRDEAMGNFADEIELTLLPDNYIRVADNGRGIPVDKHKKTGLSALDTIMTTLHAGGKFGEGGSGYKVSGGLHGVGVSVVNALSNHTRAEVHRDGNKYVQEYNRGQKVANVKKVGKTDHTGTIITFQPDAEIFPKIEFNWQKIIARVRQQAYLVKGMRVRVIDARSHSENLDATKTVWLSDQAIGLASYSFYFEGGLKSFVTYYNQTHKPVQKNIFHMEKDVENAGESGQDVNVEIAFQYVDDIQPRLVTFANNIYTPEGGMHLTGFKTGLTRTLNSYARDNKLLKDKDDNFSGDDTLEGLTAVVSVKLPEVQFEGQTKAKLGSVEARSAVESVFAESLSEFLEENPSDAKSIINKAVLAQRARKAAKAAKDSVLRKGALDGMTLPGKLADCQSKSADESELFIVEGDSAGGTAKMGRDRRTQAILPLRGKILNVERARLDRMLGNEQIKNLVIAMGTAIGDTFDIEKLRYGKVIIATDADVDGAHIRTLLLTLFYRYFRPLLDSGNVYIAMPPLYKISQGKKSDYLYTEGEKEKWYADNGIVEDKQDDIDENVARSEAGEVEVSEDEAKDNKKTKKISVQRYKGLGEMNADELWETTMDPTARLLKRVDVEDAAEADRIFDVLMGTDVSSRKSFIQSNAQMANVDL